MDQITLGSHAEALRILLSRCTSTPKPRSGGLDFDLIKNSFDLIKICYVSASRLTP